MMPLVYLQNNTRFKPVSILQSPLNKILTVTVNNWTKSGFVMIGTEK